MGTNKCSKWPWCNNDHDGKADKLCSKCRPRKKPKQPCRKCLKPCNGTCKQCSDCKKWQSWSKCQQCKDAFWEANKKAMEKPLATFAPIKLGGNPVNSVAAWESRNGRPMRTNQGTNENPHVVDVDAGVLADILTSKQAHSLARYFGGKFRRRLADTSIQKNPRQPNSATYRCCVSEDIPMTRQRRL